MFDLLDPLTYLLLALAAGFAGFVDAIAGGGGIITVPALLAAGLPPHLALGTNKLQASFGSLSASFSYRAKGLVRFRHEWKGVVWTGLGASLGTAVVLLISPGVLKIILPVGLGLVALFLLLRPQKGVAAGSDGAVKHPLSYPAAALVGGLAIGFYDGFIGPGTGTFWVLLLTLAAGLEIGAATARTKVFNFTSNVVSLAVFVVGGTVLWVPGLVMGAMQALGAWLGSRAAVRRGPGFIRIMVTLATMAMLVWVVLRNILGI